MKEKTKIGIIGLGLIGGSIALALSGDYAILGYDTDGATREYAKSHGICEIVEPKEMRAAALIFVCVPVFCMAEALENARAAVGDKVVIADVASVKMPYAGLISGYVGTHPMAGTERGGIASAKKHLFENAYWVITDKGERADFVRAVIEKTGAKPLYMSAEEHDRTVAKYSHVPHAIAYALVTTATDGAQPIAGSGFMDTTRIAASDERFWTEVFLNNGDNVSRGLGEVVAELNKIDGMIKSGDRDGLMKYLGAARVRRSALNRVDLGGEVLYVDLVDRIGEFERVTGAVARAGINLTNIALVPGREGASGALRLEFGSADDKTTAARVLGIDLKNDDAEDK